MPDRIAVGRINATWGLRGHVKVTPFTSNPTRFTVGAMLYVNGEARRVMDVNTSQGYPIVQFDGYTDANAAATLRDTLIEIDEAALPALPEGEYYLHDLVGLEVVTREGEPIGTLVEVLTTGANDVYVVRRPSKANALIPAIPDVILSVDLAAKRMTIEAMPGLLD
jgi:16S rRNA processing protein RimM